MKKIPTLLIGSLLLMLQMKAAPAYNVTANTSWTTLIGNTFCTGCTFNLSSGVTFTLNTGNYCEDCTFNGGTLQATSEFTVHFSSFVNTKIILDDKKLNLNAGSKDNVFTGTSVTASGSGGVVQTGKTTMTNSYFTFSGQAQYFENGGQLDMTGTRIYLTENASFYANAGPVNLNSKSNITAGDGTAASKAYIYMNGPQLTLVDANSTFSVANSNNYYFNWGSYSSTSNSMTYNTATAAGTSNCGTAGKNSCSVPKYYGCALFTKTGASNCTVLSATIAGLSGVLQDGNQVRISWSLLTADQGTMTVERSADASTFERINSRSAQAATGYSFTDANPAAGTNYYRVTFTSFDGVTTQSGILSVKTNAAVLPGFAQVFPNPATNGHVTIRLSSTRPALLSVFTQDGRLLTGTTLSGQTDYPVQLPKTAPGLLVVRIISGDQTTTFSLVNKS